MWAQQIVALASPEFASDFLAEGLAAECAQGRRSAFRRHASFRFPPLSAIAPKRLVMALPFGARFRLRRNLACGAFPPFGFNR